MLTCFCMLFLLGQPQILPDEIQWLDDPNILPTLFTEWNEERAEPYIIVLKENWLRKNRLRTYPKEIDGKLYDTWHAPYSWAGDLNHDDITNLKDFAIMAKYSQGGVHTDPTLVVRCPPDCTLHHTEKELSIEELMKLMQILFMEVK